MPAEAQAAAAEGEHEGEDAAAAAALAAYVAIGAQRSGQDQWGANCTRSDTHRRRASLRCNGCSPRSSVRCARRVGVVGVGCPWYEGLDERFYNKHIHTVQRTDSCQHMCVWRGRKERAERSEAARRERKWSGEKREKREGAKERSKRRRACREEGETNAPRLEYSSRVDARDLP